MVSAGTRPLGIPRLSAIDFGPTHNLPSLARALDALGFYRLWVTEHRSRQQSASPIVLAGVAASVTKEIKIGTAGVMLRYTSPLKVAEDFHTLQAIFPGRVGLGTIRGKESLELVHHALLDGRSSDVDDYDRRLETLLKLLRQHPSRAVPEHIRFPARDFGGAPEIWQCGISESSVSSAATNGVALAYYPAIARSIGRADGPSLLAHYRDAFRPCEGLAHPETMVVCFGCCGDTSTLAEEQWRDAVGVARERSVTIAGRLPMPVSGSPDFLGSRAECYEQLNDIAAEYGATELAIHCPAVNHASALYEYRAIAEIFGLKPR